jgi:hypothetical protein
LKRDTAIEKEKFMSWKRSWILWAAAVVFAGGSAWALSDSPSGSPPFGLDFADGTSGQQYQGYVTLLFRDFDGTLSPAFEAVTRLRKGNEIHVFRTDYDCSVSDPCGICTTEPFPDPDPNNPGPFEIDVSNAVNIQLCLQDSIELEVIADFELTNVDVRLKNIGGFTSEVDPADPSVLVIAADVEVTTK